MLIFETQFSYKAKVRAKYCPALTGTEVYNPELDNERVNENG